HLRPVGTQARPHPTGAAGTNTPDGRNDRTHVNENTLYSFPTRFQVAWKWVTSVGTVLRMMTAEENASRTPKVPASTDKSSPSVSICRMMRVRLAPIDIRTAISLCLAVAPAKRRFATFTQAINKTNPT